MSKYADFCLPAGMIGPFVLGAMKHARGDYTAASALLALIMACGATVAFVMLPLVSDDATLQPVKVCAHLGPGHPYR